jgi:hypothetical protein
MHGFERPRRVARYALMAATCLLAGAACNLDVTKPDIITPNNLAGKDALPTIRDAALGDFALAYSGSGADGSSGTEGIIMASGLLADEFINSETFPTRIEVDRRSIQTTNSTVTGWFRSLMRARRSVEFAAAQYRALSPDTTKETGFPELIALSGYMYLFFAENYCSGVPVSTANADGSLVFGAPLTTDNLLDSAVARFQLALADARALNGVSGAAQAADSNLAKVGLGRALLDKASRSSSFAAGAAAAATAVAGVPTNFVYVVYHSNNTTRQNNGVYVAMAIAKRYSVADGEGVNGLKFRTAGDGRVPTARTGNGFDGSTPQWNQMRFTDRPNPDPLATGAEARLIEAESFLANADTVNFLARHNALRAAPPAYFNAPAPATPVAALPALTTTGLTSSQVQDLHFKEREYWLWNSGHRLGDLRRETHAPYSRAPESVFPTGAYFKGGTYGTDYNFPVPFDETNNPNFTQCIDRNP